MDYSANVKCQGKELLGIDALTILSVSSPNGEAGILLKGLNKGKKKSNLFLAIDKNSRIKINVNGNVNYVEFNNCGVIKGNVEKVKAGNCIYVEGFVEHNCGTRDLSVNKYYYVGEKDDRLPWVAEKQGNRSKVIHIEGNLNYLSINISGYSVKPTIIGDVEVLEVTNCVEIKGNVNYATAGNLCEATMGKSKTNKSEVRQNAKNILERYKKIDEKFFEGFGDIFGI